MAFAIWITGLPGCGKSSISKEVKKQLRKYGIDIEILALDAIRKRFVPEPKYTEEERDFVYNKFIDEGIKLLKQNKNIIFDATAHRKKWRDRARKEIKNFIEVYVKIPVEKAIEFETRRKNHPTARKIYERAMERLKTGKTFQGLGPVIGVDVPYEENENADILVDRNPPRWKEDWKKAITLIINKLKQLKWIG